MRIGNPAFPVTRLPDGQFTAKIDHIWKAADKYCRLIGKVKENGKYQGVPPY